MSAAKKKRSSKAAFSGSPNQAAAAPPKKYAAAGRAGLWIFLGLLGAALGLAGAAWLPLAVQWAPGWWPWPELWRYADSEIPMLFSADGYYYMRLAAESLEKGAGPNTPWLSAFAAHFSRWFAQPVEAAAFFLPIIFSLGLGLLAMAWSRLLKTGLGCGFLAALAVNLIPAWVERSGPGWFDTDPPIAFFWQTGLLLLVWTVHENRRWWGRLLSFGGALASLWLLARVWNGGIGLAVGTLLAWFFFCLFFKSFLNVKYRLILAGALTAWLIMMMVLPPDQAPAPTKQTIHFLGEVNKLKAMIIRPTAMYSYIQELRGLSPSQWLTALGGNPVGGLAMLLSALALLAAFPAARLPVALGLGFVALGSQSERFIYLAALPLALGLGLLPRSLPLLVGRRFPNRVKLSGRLALILSLALLAGSAHWSATREYKPHWNREHDRLALALRQAAPPGSKLWHWWDEGYFLAARTQLSTFFDGGGRQTATMTHIAARPLVMESRRLAARWIRFFAIRGQAGMKPLIKAWGEERAWRKLEVLLQKGKTPETEKDLAKLPGGESWLFPKGRVFWYLPRDFVRLSNWWVPLGLSHTLDQSLVRPHLEAVPRTDFQYDPRTSTLSLTQKLRDRGYNQFGAVLDTKIIPLKSPWPTAEDPYLVFSDDNTHYGYITDRLGLKTLPLALLAPGGVKLDRFFRPVVVDYAHGGVWEVRP